MAKIKMKKVDFKQLLVQKGERIGLGAAGVVCGLMILPMFWFLFFGESSKALVDDLKKGSDDLKNKQAISAPTVNDKPDKDALTNATVQAREKVSKEKYVFASLFMQPAQEDSSKRQLVHVLVPVEGHVDVALTQLKSYILDANGEKIMKLIVDPSMGSGPPSSSNYGSLSKAYGRGTGGGARPSGPPSGAPPSGAPPSGRSPYRPPNSGSVGAQNNKPDLRAEMIPTDEIANLTSDRLADTVQPVRMAIIECSYPYHKQIKEFQDRLHLASEQLVVNETVPDDQAPDKVRHTFSFLSPLVQRRLVDVHGNPLGEWTSIDLGERYLDLLRVNGQRFEPESPELDAVSFDGLVMPKMAVMGKDQYPDSERSLGELQKTLAELAKAAKKGSAIVQPKNPLSTKGFDPFAKPRQSDTTSPNGTSPMPGSMPPPMPGSKPPPSGIGARPPPGSGNDPKAGTGTDIVPEYCLIRLIDVSIEPGKFYQYRIKVRMANPNLGMKDMVASPNYATDPKPLESLEWFEIRPKSNGRQQLAVVPLVGGEVLSLVLKQNSSRPQIVVVPPEYHLYTVDQQEIDVVESKDRRYYGQNAGVPKDRQVAFQIHKWLEVTDENPSNPSVPVGEWSVAERVLVYRGEYIGRKQRVEVPYWRSQKEMFVLATDPSLPGKIKKSGLEVDFGPPIPEGTPSDPPFYPILVDFNGGLMPHRERVIGKGKDGKDEVVKFDERVGVETLILSADGKLVAEYSWTDKTDSMRVKRLDDWRKRIDDVKNFKDTGSGTPPTDPFKGPNRN